MSTRLTSGPSLIRQLRGKAWQLGCAATVASLLGGCASPARPGQGLRVLSDQRSIATNSTAAAIGGHLPGTCDNAGSMTEPLNGEYDAVVTLLGAIEWRFTFTAEAIAGTAGRRNARFKANTRPDVAGLISGGRVSLKYGSLLAQVLFPEGMLLSWTSEMPSDPAQAGKGFVSIAPLIKIPTYITPAYGEVNVMKEDSSSFCTLHYTKRSADATPLPLADYPAIASEVTRVLGAGVYDPAILASPQNETFISALNELARVAHDDLEFNVGLHFLPAPYKLAQGTREGFISDQFIHRIPPTIHQPHRVTQRTEPAAASEPAASTTGVAGISRPIYPVFTLNAAFAADFQKQLDAPLPPGGVVLVINDDQQVLQALSLLIDEPIEMGTFFGPRARAHVLNQDTAQIPLLEIGIATTWQSLMDQLEQSDAVRLRLLPAPRTYQGPVAVIQSSQSQGASEVVAHLLRQRPNTRFFGSSSGGGTHLVRSARLSEEYSTWYPAYDWRPSVNPFAPEVNPQPVAPLRCDERCSKSAAEKRALAWLERSATTAHAAR